MQSSLDEDVTRRLHGMKGSEEGRGLASMLTGTLEKANLSQAS